MHEPELLPNYFRLIYTSTTERYIQTDTPKNKKEKKELPRKAYIKKQISFEPLREILLGKPNLNPNYKTQTMVLSILKNTGPIIKKKKKNYVYTYIE